MTPLLNKNLLLKIYPLIMTASLGLTLYTAYKPCREVLLYNSCVKLNHFSTFSSEELLDENYFNVWMILFNTTVVFTSHHGQVPLHAVQPGLCHAASYAGDL